MSDIRLMTGFLDNPKVIKLKRRKGADAVLGLLRFWFYVAENKPDGLLTGVDAEDIEIACGEQAFSMLEAMLELRFVTVNADGVYVVHDWEENQPWVASAPKRKEIARNAARERWEKKKPQKKQTHKGDAPSMLVAYDEHAGSNAPYLTLPNHKKNVANLTIPPSLAYSRPFAEAWVEWEKYRASKNKKITEHALKKQMDNLGKYPIDVCVEAINKSIENDWTGLFPEKIQKPMGRVHKRSREDLIREFGTA